MTKTLEEENQCQPATVCAGPSGPRQLFRRHKSRVSQSSEGHPAAGPDGEPRDAAVVQAHTQPSLGRKLQSPARRLNSVSIRIPLSVPNETRIRLQHRDEPSEKPWTRAPPPTQHKPADEIADDIGMTHDDLVAVLLLRGVGPVDVVAEGSLNASPVFVVLLEYGTEVETRP